jgi:flagellar biosynthesis anti-sigma factor FlgM
MRIDLNSSNIDALHNETARRVGERREFHFDEKKDTVALSSGGMKLSQMMAAALSAPEIRADRVAALRASIESGTYTTDPGAIADTILKNLF